MLDKIKADVRKAKVSYIAHRQTHVFDDLRKADLSGLVALILANTGTDEVIETMVDKASFRIYLQGKAVDIARKIQHDLTNSKDKDPHDALLTIVESGFNPRSLRPVESFYNFYMNCTYPEYGSLHEWSRTSRKRHTKGDCYTIHAYPSHDHIRQYPLMILARREAYVDYFPPERIGEIYITINPEITALERRRRIHRYENELWQHKLVIK
jgi:hypothetical protein